MREIGPDEQVSVDLVVDGVSQRLVVESRTSLADALRDAGQPSSVRLACEEGVCGACTVVLEGRPQRSCLVLAVQAEGAQVQTAAGLGPSADELRAALSRNFAIQCGFCASGLMVTASEWLAEQRLGEPFDAANAERAVRQMLSGNICRCTGYEGMVRSIVELLADG